MTRFSVVAGFAALLMVGPVAHAADAEIVGRADLLAGPSQDFPNVRILPDGAQVDVHGCLNTWRWCDVTWRGKRGWVNSASVAYGGARESLPTIAFDFSDYWDKNYRSQFFYSDKAKWGKVAERQILAAQDYALAARN